MYASKGKARPPATPREARDRLSVAIRHAREAEHDLRALITEEGLA
jgi:hypothetical protein